MPRIPCRRHRSRSRTPNSASHSVQRTGGRWRSVLRLVSVSRNFRVAESVDEPIASNRSRGNALVVYLLIMNSGTIAGKDGEGSGGKTETILRRPRRGVYRATKAAVPATRWRLQRRSQASVVGSGLDAQSARYCRCRTFGCDRTSQILLGSCRGQSSLWRRQTPCCGHVAVGFQERWGKGKARPSLH